jgi:hypothetical protein
MNHIGCIESGVARNRSLFHILLATWFRAALRADVHLHPYFWRFKKLTCEQMSQPTSLNGMGWDGMGWDGMVVLGGKFSRIDVLVQDNNINQIGYIESGVLVIRTYLYLFHILLASDLLLFTFALRVSFLNLEKYGSSKSTQCVVTMASPYYCLNIFLTKWPSYPIPSHLPKLVATFAWE